MNGIEFEHFVSHLMQFQEFKTEVTKGSHDFGVGIIAEKDGYKYAVQVKRQVSPVSRRAVSDSVAGMKVHACDGSMVITNSYYSKAAIQFADLQSCVLVDRDVLIAWLLEFRAS